MMYKKSPYRFLVGLVCILGSLAGCSSRPLLESAPAATGPAHPISSADRKAKSTQLVRLARAMVGKPYHYGGSSPRTGFDCSGLVYFTHRRIGRTLPRTSQGQYRVSRPIKRSELKMGDLLFFRINRRKISHVGIYLGHNRFVHAPSSGKVVSIARLDSPYWKKRFVRGGRIL